MSKHQQQSPAFRTTTQRTASSWYSPWSGGAADVSTSIIISSSSTRGHRTLSIAAAQMEAELKLAQSSDGSGGHLRAVAGSELSLCRRRRQRYWRQPPAGLPLPWGTVSSRRRLRRHPPCSQQPPIDSPLLPPAKRYPSHGGRKE